MGSSAIKNPKKIFSQSGSNTDQTVIDGSTNPVSGNAVFDYVETKSAFIKKLTGDVTSIITTETVLTDTTFAVEANSTYVIRGRMTVGCSGTGGVKIGGNFPSGSISNIHTFGRTSSSTTFNSSGISTSGLLGGTFNTVASQAGFVEFNGILNTSVTAGNFEFIFASIVAGQTSTIAASGFYLEYFKI